MKRRALRSPAAKVQKKGAWADPFILLLLLTLTAAALFPPENRTGAALSVVAGYAVALQFFISGLRLSSAAAVAGLTSWRTHLLILIFSFVVLPAAGIGLAAASAWYLPGELVTGIIFLTMLPTAIQTAVTFTGIAKGNVATAVCAASLSNLLAVVVTPLLVLLVLGSEGRISAASALKVVLQIVVPFLLGQFLNRWLGPWAHRHVLPLKVLDRSAIMLVVFTAFGASVSGGIWKQMQPVQLVVTGALCALILAAALWLTALAGRRLLPSGDRAALIFCGSEKSLAAALPLSAALFSGSVAGVVILPVILYHVMQLIVCAFLARRLTRHSVPGAIRGEDRRNVPA